MIRPANVRLIGSAGRIAPVEYRDAVELYAREFGRHADIVWIPEIRTWQVRFTLMPDDPLGGLEGEERFETVELVRPGTRPHPRTGQPMPYMAPIELEELGVSGLLEYLRKGNTWSGRGEYRSQAEAERKIEEANRERSERRAREARQTAIDRAQEERRLITGQPQVPVGIDLTQTTKE